MDLINIKTYLQLSTEDEFVSMDTACLEKLLLNDGYFTYVIEHSGHVLVEAVKERLIFQSANMEYIILQTMHAAGILAYETFVLPRGTSSFMKSISIENPGESLIPYSSHPLRIRYVKPGLSYNGRGLPYVGIGHYYTKYLKFGVSGASIGFTDNVNFIDDTSVSVDTMGIYDIHVSTLTRDFFLRLPIIHKLEITDKGISILGHHGDSLMLTFNPNYPILLSE